MIEKPKPLDLIGLDPKQTLKSMLENSDKKDRGEKYTSPLDTIDPMTLDELIVRIDTGSLALNQAPDPEDIEKLVDIYWSMREKFALEQQMGIVTRPKKKSEPKSEPKRVTVLTNISEMLKAKQGEEEEEE